MNDWTWFAYGNSSWLAPLLVAIGGAIGSVCRYALSQFISASQVSVLPWGTMAVNIIGSFIIGALSVAIPAVIIQVLPYPAVASGCWNQIVGFLFITGFCGGFTTFSSATLDAGNLIRAGHWAAGIGSVLITLVATLAAVTLGIFAAVQVLNSAL
jgi:CrcB protein